MTGLSIAQYKESAQYKEAAEAAVRTLLRVTEDARTNLNTLSDDDIRKSLPYNNKRYTPSSLKNGVALEITLRDAANINARAGREILKLAPEHITRIFVPQSDITRFQERKLVDKDITRISQEISKLSMDVTADKICQYMQTLNRSKPNQIRTVDIEYADALNNYFYANFKIKLFDIEGFFEATVKFIESELQKSLSASPGTDSSVRGIQAKRPLEQIPEDRSSKRTKYSNETPVNSVPSLSHFVEQAFYTPNFTQDDQSWL